MVVLRSPKDRYGMMGFDEKEIPSPAFNGMQAQTRREPEPEPGRYDVRDESPETVDHVEIEGGKGGDTTGDDWPLKKKKKKKKKKVK